jgi:predicted RND superfamily exporter protein
MRLLTYLVDKHPLWIIIVLSAVTLVLIPPLFNQSFNVSTEKFIPDTDIERIRYDRFIEAFGRDTFLLLILPAENIFSDETLSLLIKLRAELLKLDEVSSVFSVAEAVKIDRSSVPPRVVSLVPTIPLSESRRSELRANVFSQSITNRKVASPDGRTAIVTVYLNTGIETSDETRTAAVTKVRAVLNRELGDRRFELTGVPLLKTEISLAVRHDLMVLGPTVALVSLLFLWLAFRRFWVLVAGALAVGMALVWTMSVFSILGLALTMSTTLLPSLTLAIGLAHTIFIVSQYQRSEGGPHERIRYTLRRATPPCFLAAVTTMAGFASLGATGVVPVREFGLMAALGIFFAFIISILLVPSLLRIRPEAVPPRDLGVTPRWITKLCRLTAHRGLITAVTIIILVVSAFGISRVRIETSPYDFFPENDPLNRARRLIKTEFGSSSVIDLQIGRRDGELLNGASLLQAESLRKRLSAEPLVVDSVSLLSISELIAGDAARFAGFLGNRPVKTVLDAIGGTAGGQELFQRYISPDGRRARMTLVLKEPSAERVIEVLDRVEALAPEAAPDLEVVPTGQTVLFTKMVDDLFLSQVTSVFMILAFVTVIFICAYRSFSIGLISLIPNITPIIMTLGIMGWLGIPLNVLTIMVSSIAIGIAVDDTIHILHHMRGRLAEGGTHDEAVEHALRSKGRPVVFTSLLLTCAFLTHVISDFRPTVYLGALTAITMITALLGDLILLPALVRFFRPRFRQPSSADKP